MGYLINACQGLHNKIPQKQYIPRYDLIEFANIAHKGFY